ncbi:MAG: hypothetical protein QGG15_04895 [Dehalococcoidales bacterium]|nr:hypothetical protein [Dehalococcoidales bacterium]MDP6738339.1 hypothetical protein [Dehalococcoidales bacterium]
MPPVKPITFTINLHHLRTQTVSETTQIPLARTKLHTDETPTDIMTTTPASKVAQELIIPSPNSTGLPHPIKAE